MLSRRQRLSIVFRRRDPASSRRPRNFSVLVRSPNEAVTFDRSVRQVRIKLSNKVLCSLPRFGNWILLTHPTEESPLHIRNGIVNGCGSQYRSAEYSLTKDKTIVARCAVRTFRAVISRCSDQDSDNR